MSLSRTLSHRELAGENPSPPSSDEKIGQRSPMTYVPQWEKPVMEMPLKIKKKEKKKQCSMSDP